MKSSAYMYILVALLVTGTLSPKAEAQAPPPTLGEPERQAKITDQLERLVSRPHAIALTPDQRRSVDSLKAKYLKEVLVHEKESPTKDPMESGKEFRKKQLSYYEAVQKLLTPSQLADFEKNRYAASVRER